LVGQQEGHPACKKLKTRSVYICREDFHGHYFMQRFFNENVLSATSDDGYRSSEWMAIFVGFANTGYQFLVLLNNCS